MGCRVMYDPEAKIAAFYCSTTDVAFGPVCYEKSDGDWTAAETLEFFMRWLDRDPREYSEGELENLLVRFLEADPKECDWMGCDWRHRRIYRYADREKRPAARVYFDDKPNPAYKDGFCSEECRDAAGEDAYDRSVEAFYGASTPQTEGERYAAAAEEKRRLG